MSTEPRSPLHVHALVSGELVLDRRVLYFNLQYGMRGEFIVESHPYQQNDGWVIDLRNAESGERETLYLTDMGAMPYSDGSFNTVNFVVDQSDRDTLPTALLPYGDEDRRHHRHLPFADEF